MWSALQGDISLIMNVWCVQSVHIPLQDLQAAMPVRWELSRAPELISVKYVLLAKLRQPEALRALLSFAMLAST